MISFQEHPVIHLILSLFRNKKEAKPTIQWSNTEVKLYYPETPPCNEYYPKKQSGRSSPPILKYPTYTKYQA